MAGTLTITSPATDSQSGFSSSSILIAWSFTGTGGATQTQWRLTSTRSGASSKVYDTGMQAGTQTSLQVDQFATGVSYDVTVTVIDTAGATSSATRVVVSNYTRPLPPVLSLWAADYGVAVGITNPTDGSRPAVTTNDVYRRLAGSGSDWTYLGSVGPGATFTDVTAAAMTAYEYFARANGQIDSPISSTSGAPIMGAWVADITNPLNTGQHYQYAQAATESVDLESALLNFVGRTYPVPEVGIARNDTLAVSIRLPPDVRQSGEETWRGWRRTATTLFYRDGRGRAWPAVIAGPVAIAPDGPGSVVTATLQRVDYTPRTLPAGAYGYIANVDGGNGVYGNGSQGNGN